MQGSAYQIDVNSLVYKNEKSLFVIHFVFALLFWLALIAGTFGAVLVYILLLFVGYLFAQSALIAWIKGNGVKISADQFPDLYARYVNCCNMLGFKTYPDAYLMNGGGMLNAFATRFLGRNFVVLYSNVVDSMADNPEAINFYIGHELGHLQRKHLQWGAFLWPSSILPIIGSAYARACEYTCDQFGRACCKEPLPAMQGLVALAAGEKRWATINIPAYLSQAKDTGSFWMAFHELVADYPWLVKRAARIDNTRYSSPRRNPFAWILALFVPRIGIGGGAAGLMMMVAIIGILAAIAIPAYKQYVEKAKQASAPSEISSMQEEDYYQDAYPEERADERSAAQQPEDYSENLETEQPSSDIEYRIMQAASEIKANSPKMIDADTRLDGAVAGPGLKLTFLYTLPNIETAQVSQEAFDTVLGPTIVKSACSSKELRPFIDSAVSIFYEYHGKDGSTIGAIEVNSAECVAI